MSDNRKTKLLPCPFSGDRIWEPFSVKWTNCLGDVSYSATVICEACNRGIKCEIRTESAGYKTPEEAKAAIIAILNSRSFDSKALDRRLIATYLQRSELNHVIAERDEWKAKCETREFAYKQADAERKRYSEQIDELLAERDEWKAKLAELRAYKDMDSNTLDSRM